MAKKRSKPTMISGVRRLGKAVGVSHTAAADWVKHEAWTFGRGPWRLDQVPQMLAWARRNLSPDPNKADPSDVGAVETPKSRQVKLKNQKLTIELAEMLKLVHRTDECELRRTRQILAVKNRIFSECDGLPLPPAAIEVVRNWLISIVADFHGGNGG